MEPQIHPPASTLPAPEPPKAPFPAFISPAAAASHVDVSRRTIDRAIADGSLPAYRAGSRVVRIRVTDLEAWLRPIEAA